MDFLRHSARNSKLDKIRNETVRQKMNTKTSVLDFIKYRQLEWYGHVRRMADDKLPLRILEWNPLGRQKWGWPRKTWISDITHTMQKKGLEELDWNHRIQWWTRIKV